MTKPASSLYTTNYTINHADVGEKIGRRLARGCQLSTKRPLVFFRADDIGIPSRGFQQLIECFQKHRLPLCLATVPAWLTETRWRELCRVTGTKTAQWCWHQHGRVHRNFEQTGKKQEFGPARTRSEIVAGLILGRARLERLLGSDFHPVFTPPWNRCTGDTLQALVDLDYKAVSRNKGARPAPPAILPDYQVNVDLHTRKEIAPHRALENLLTELEQGIGSGLCGIMIHHQRMNGPALLLLDILLDRIRRCVNLTPVHFGDLGSLGQGPLITGTID
jgi:hypothetical protein